MNNSNDERKVPRIWLRILLICSLSLNLLIVGAAIGAVFKWRGGPPRFEIAGNCGSGGMTAIVRAMERSERAAIRDAFEAGGFGRDFRRAATQDDIDGLIQILNSDPFDADGLKSILQVRSEQLAKELELGHGIIFDRISSMPEDQRRRLAERIEDKRDHRHHK
ncbi:MAG: periplasmic heavy metal sensor [Albidovulum sp.]|nr:periplasmic heavy metal sensor [Albidovulum sp.]MDE0306590.1 periplasmic heavy metal sensor [Albidovulum sp.]MDE0530526.1 periplasmic heavy metal sensor [Albidovulum sp.]